MPEKTCKQVYPQLRVRRCFVPDVKPLARSSAFFPDGAQLFLRELGGARLAAQAGEFRNREHLLHPASIPLWPSNPPRPFPYRCPSSHQDWPPSLVPASDVPGVGEIPKRGRWGRSNGESGVPLRPLRLGECKTLHLIASGSLLAEIAASNKPHRKIQVVPSSPRLRNLVVVSRTRIQIVSKRASANS
jgi:hypothetical protein